VPSDATPRLAEVALGSLVSMPIYEYVCMSCESHFEELVKPGERPPCPDCGSERVQKQLSVFAAHGTSTQPSFGGGGGCCGGSCGCGGH
jgi:putative FmdB family regulatory protein